jgi:ketosteroid isomerase-like protein
MGKLMCVMGAMLLVGLSSAQTKSAKTGTTGQAGAAAIERIDRERSQAIVKGDLATIDKTTADTYVFTDATGRVSTQKELIDGLKKGTMKLQSQDASDVKVQFYGNTAVETGKIISQGTRNGQDVGGTFRFTRVWVNHNGTWQTVAFQETKIQ